MRLRILTILSILLISEILVFGYVSDTIGLINTALISVLTAFFGIVLLKFQGLSILDTVHRNFILNKIFIEKMFDKLCIIFAVFLLFIPGLITDIIGILILLPPVRFILKSLLVQYIKTKISTGTSKDAQFEPPDKSIIDGEFQDITEIKDVLSSRSKEPDRHKKT